MFEHFSFAVATKHCALHNLSPMEDSISPASSREAIPCYDSNYHGSARCHASSTSIAELSRRFDQQSLEPRARIVSIDASNPRPCEQHQTSQAPTSFSNRMCHRRQSFNRLQYSTAHLSQISALMEDIVPTDRSLYESGDSPPILDDSTSSSLSPDEIPQHSSSYFSLKKVPFASAEISDLDPIKHLPRQISFKIDKDLRHCLSRESVGSQKVMKKIRLRKSSRRLVTAPGKRCDG